MKKKKEKEYLYLKIEVNMMANGKMENMMEKVYILYKQRKK